MLNLNESYKQRIQLLAGIITEDDTQNKTAMLSKSDERVPFNRALMKQAIEQGREIGLLFKSDNEKYTMPVSKYRVVRPVAMGTSNKGKTVIRGLHIIGQSEKKAIETGSRSAEANSEWRLFDASNIKGMWLTDNFFDVAPAGYNPNDQQMRSIEVAFSPSKAKGEQTKLAQQRNSDDTELQKQADLDKMQQQVDQVQEPQEAPDEEPQSNEMPEFDDDEFDDTEATISPGQMTNQFAG